MTVHIDSKRPFLKRYGTSFFITLIILCVSIFISIILPLRGLLYHESLLGNLFPWIGRVTRAFFPSQSLTFSEPIRAKLDTELPSRLSLTLAWEDTAILFATLVLLFLIYLAALRQFVAAIHLRTILISTALIGVPFLLTNALTSSDVFSYIAYARMGVFYNLNPMTATPNNISTDPIYLYTYWKAQPSAYGPVWIAITWGIQSFLQSLGLNGIAPMVFSLRIFALLAHLTSTALIWSMLGRLLPADNPASPHKRTIITLAFAWNPLLLFEATVNAHNEITVLFLLLLSLWCIVRWERERPYLALLGIVAFALATSLKINYILLAPAFLLYLWMQKPRKLPLFASAILLYIGTIALLYTPFWQNGQVLRVFLVNPATNRNINTPFEFITGLFNSIYSTVAGTKLPPLGTSPIEHATHLFSLISFALLYLGWCVYTVRRRDRMEHFSGLVRWMAVVWLIYCIFGTPWFWPWYTVSFIGLYTLIVICPEAEETHFEKFCTPPVVLTLAFSALTIYCFYTWAVSHTFMPGIAGFSLAALRGLWIAIPPFIPLFYNIRHYRQERVLDHSLAKAS